ncbi:MAG: UvrD-helicase domain-containing protein [Methanocorpusculum sp.]|uniref:UvrD-helicase domain-containing protein n=1 Tax=Methanocorpusculum sp. TaxID=2058474 RepID=UPI00271C5E51|nr:UvrD-helicase domain-containing protein [Methanocorpusculum sp.]MDO9523228.1 UvrD-helicase domain-containing protein [Methanocorpusculum sp.]
MIACTTCSISSSKQKADIRNAQSSELLDYTHLPEIFSSFKKDCKNYAYDDDLSQYIHQKYDSYYRALSTPVIRKYIEKNISNLRIEKTQIDQFIEKYHAIRESDPERSTSNLVESNKEYFDKILLPIDKSISLDADQRKAVVTDGDHCLIIAGAGAGKTTTMAAKVKYLVDKQGISQEDIVVVSYTNEAIGELQDRINNKLHLPNVRISTFHSFAFSLIKQLRKDSENSNPEVIRDGGSYSIISDLLITKIYENKSLLRNLVLFLGYYFDLPADVFKFENLNQYHEYNASLNYQSLKSNLGEYIKKVAVKREAKTKTLTGEYLRSNQEVQIANFLYLHNLEYEYERPYPYLMPNARKKYTPDFYIQQGENNVYLEHYGISEDYQSDIFSPAELKRYTKSIQDKRNLHKEHHTTLIETWSVYNDHRQLIDHLEDVLTENGFGLELRDLTEVYEKLVATDKDKYISKLADFLNRFIGLFKSAGYTNEDFVKLRENANPRTELFLNIAEQVYEYYQDQLHQTNHIDFADMINDAYFYLKEFKKQGIVHPYKYIIIDEFQDIARQRFNLTKELADVTHAQVIAVGDDWQSIFAFSGSDITLFLKFREIMGSGKELQINHTYRNSQQLIDIAGSFIQKNSSQITKKLISPKSLTDPIVLVPYDDSQNAIQNLADVVTGTIGKICEEYGYESKILLMGRYNFDMKNLVNTKKFTEIQKGKSKREIRCVQYPEAKLAFMTAHSAKGLGYDNVILLNMREGKFGFPCQIEDDPILKLVTHEDMTIPFAEERRLFYVALTRTKNHIYIATPKYNPSRFLLELIKDYPLSYPEDMSLKVTEKSIYKCPVCGCPLKYEYNKNYGIHLYLCTNEPEICNFMTNDIKNKYDIKKCPACEDGYLIVKVKNGDVFYGCTNYQYSNCNYMESLLSKTKFQ